MFYVCSSKNSFTLQNIMFFNKKICTKICKKVCIKVCMNYKKKGMRCCPQSLLFGAGGGTCSQVSTWLRRRASKDGCQPHCVSFKCKAFVAQSAKVPPTKKDPKVFLVLVVGLEPTRSPTRPLNVRVCHSATPASMDYVSIIIFCCQEILKKNLLLVS